MKLVSRQLTIQPYKRDQFFEQNFFVFVIDFLEKKFIKIARLLILIVSFCNDHSTENLVPSVG